MINVFAIIIVFGAVVYYEAPRLIRQKLWRELAVVVVVALIGVTVSVARTTGALYKCWVDVVGLAGRYLSGLVGLQM